MSCLDKFHILEINNLSVSFTQYAGRTKREELPVISNLNVSVHEGEIVAVVGASGSGKSLLAHAILGLLPGNARWSGELFFLEEELDEERMKRVRGREIALVPQSVNYLDPLMKVGSQVRGEKKSGERKRRQRGLFQKYGLDLETEERYPFQCSGGMSRRILLSTALMEEPRLLIADEPTPGMELAMAKKAMEDFRRFADEGNGVLLITHDIELALEVADRIAVFYAGTTVEEALAGDFASEDMLRHPYTKALWRAMPQNGFQVIEGSQPYVKELPKGCFFGPRCPQFSSECEGEIPERIVRCGTVRCVKYRGDASPHLHEKHVHEEKKHLHEKHMKGTHTHEKYTHKIEEDRHAGS